MKQEFQWRPSSQVVQAKNVLERSYSRVRDAREELATSERRALDALAELLAEQDRDDSVRARVRETVASNSQRVRRG